jgi:hypothetical protein
VTWQHTKRTGKPHKRHGHLDWLGPRSLPSQLVDLARRKAEGEAGAETHDLLSRFRVLANRLAVGIQALQDTHGLKKVKPVRFLTEAAF